MTECTTHALIPLHLGRKFIPQASHRLSDKTHSGHSIQPEHIARDDIGGVQRNMIEEISSECVAAMEDTVIVAPVEQQQQSCRFNCAGAYYNVVGCYNNLASTWIGRHN